MNPNCVSCGMPMRTPQEHAAGDPTRNYCLHCCRPDGAMKSYDEVLAGMTGFLVKTQGFSQDAARTAAAGMLAKLPAWKGR